LARRRRRPGHHRGGQADVHRHRHRVARHPGVAGRPGPQQLGGHLLHRRGVRRLHRRRSRHGPADRKGPRTMSITDTSTTSTAEPTMVTPPRTSFWTGRSEFALVGLLYVIAVLLTIG